MTCDWCDEAVGDEAVEIPALIFCDWKCRKDWQGAPKELIDSVDLRMSKVLLILLLCLVTNG